ncbi:hypothetical protein HYU93_03695 [Candidatus Daviesbacteria bacterium]|nr:hypothetical protein [Candidatus Daviesbacteria bacterium]
MNDIKNSLASLALDLSRVAIGLNRGSVKMADRFYQEALVRKAEIDSNKIPLYITNILAKINKDKSLNEKFAEEVLVYSTLIENFVTQKLS